MREQAGILDALDKLIKRKNDEGAKYLADQEFNQDQQLSINPPHHRAHAQSVEVATREKLMQLQTS